MEFLIDLRKVGSPQKAVKTDNIKESKKLDLSNPIKVRDGSTS